MKKTVHLMGIGGTGMVSLAGMFQETGWNVRGSDSKIYPPTSTELERLKIPVAEGYKPENLQPPPDLVIVGNVVSRGNPEVEALLKTSIPYTSMAQALAKYFLEGRRSVVVAGTHGKTTTTSLLAWILLKGGRDPGLFVGGMPKNFGQGYRIGSGEPFVVEGDEYDTAFFEKSPKFLHYTPQDVIITSIEFDHADIYRDLDHVIEQFEKLVALLPKEGTLLAWGGSDTVKKICSKRKDGEPQYYGCDSCHDWRALDTRVTSTGTAFDVEYQGKILTHIESPLLGKHNVLNAVAAIGMATKLGVNPEDSLKAVSTFEGIRRRQEFLGEARGVRVYDDFAHHPTAVAETLAAFRPMADARKGRLWAIYEPRSNTSRRRVFQDVLPRSFQPADEVVLAPVFHKKDSLSDEDLLKPTDVVEAIRRNGGSAVAAETHDQIVGQLVANAHSGDVVLFMSNGSFGGLPMKVLDELRS